MGQRIRHIRFEPARELAGDTEAERLRFEFGVLTPVDLLAQAPVNLD
jgi:hypothetical protein